MNSGWRAAKRGFFYRKIGAMCTRLSCSWFCEYNKGKKRVVCFSRLTKIWKNHRTSCPRGNLGVPCAAVGVLFWRYPQRTAHSESHGFSASQGIERLRVDTRRGIDSRFLRLYISRIPFDNHSTHRTNPSMRWVIRFVFACVFSLFRPLLYAFFYPKNYTYPALSGLIRW